MAKLETETHCIATCLSFWTRCWRTVGRCWKKTTKTFHFCYFASTTKRKRFHQQAATYKKDIRKIHFATAFSNFTNFQASNRLSASLSSSSSKGTGGSSGGASSTSSTSTPWRYLFTCWRWELERCWNQKKTETLQDLGQGLANQDASLSEFWVLANHELPKEITGVASSRFTKKSY